MRQLLILFSTIILFANCNNNKGWSAAERTKSLTQCVEKAEANNLDNNNAKKLCSCLLSKAESKYASYDAADKGISDEEGEKMATACAKDIGLNKGGGDDEETGGGKKKGGIFGGGGDDQTGGGKKKTIDDEDGGGAGGGWTKADETTFYNQCKTGLIDQGYTSSRANNLCNCFLEKIEKRYPTMKDANERGGAAAGAKAMKECLNEENTDNNDN